MTQWDKHYLCKRSQGQEEVNVAGGLGLDWGGQGTGEKGRLSLSFAKFREVERSHQGQGNSWSESREMSRGESGETCLVEVNYGKSSVSLDMLFQTDQETGTG